MKLPGQYLLFTLLLALITLSLGAPLNVSLSPRHSLLPRGSATEICGDGTRKKIKLKGGSKSYRTRAINANRPRLVKGRDGTAQNIDSFEWQNGGGILSYRNLEKLKRTRVEVDHVFEAQYAKHAIKELMFEGESYYSFCEEFRTRIGQERVGPYGRTASEQRLWEIINGEDNLLFLDSDVNNLKGSYVSAVIQSGWEKKHIMPATPSFKTTGVNNLMDRVNALAVYQEKTCDIHKQTALKLYNFISEFTHAQVPKEEYLFRVWRDFVLLDNTLLGQLPAQNWVLPYLVVASNYARCAPPDINDQCQTGDGLHRRCTDPEETPAKPLVDWTDEDWDDDSEDQGNDEVITIEPSDPSATYPVANIAAPLMAGLVIKDLFSDNPSVQRTGEVVTTSIDINAPGPTILPSESSTSTSSSSALDPASTTVPPPASSSSTSSAPSTSSSTSQTSLPPSPPPPPTSSSSASPVPTSTGFSVSLLHSLLPPLPPSIAAAPTPPP